MVVLHIALRIARTVPYDESRQRSAPIVEVIVVGAITLLVAPLAPDGVAAVLGLRGRRAGAPQEALS